MHQSHAIQAIEKVISTKADYILINMILNIHKHWTILFKQRLKTIQQQLDKSKAFSFLKIWKKHFGILNQIAKEN